MSIAYKKITLSNINYIETTKDIYSDEELVVPSGTIGKVIHDNIIEFDLERGEN